MGRRPEKNSFCLGEIGPHLGEIDVLNLAFLGFLAYFGLFLLGTLSTDFRFFDCIRQPHVPFNDAGNLTKIHFVEFEQCGSKVGNIAVSTWNIIALPEALTMAQW